MSAPAPEFTLPDRPVFPFSASDLGRLEVEPPVAEAASDFVRLQPGDWDAIHEAIQRVFGEMADQVRRRWPSIRSRAGRTSSRSFPLFTYRTFDLGPDGEIDAVIVGITFEPAPEGGAVVIRGDISGEETGRTDFEAPEKTAVDSWQGLVPAALETALVLEERWPLVGKTVLERLQPPVY
jgi:hypothetical protein